MLQYCLPMGLIRTKPNFISLHFPIQSSKPRCFVGILPLNFEPFLEISPRFFREQHANAMKGTVSASGGSPPRVPPMELMVNTAVDEDDGPMPPNQFAALCME